MKEKKMSMTNILRVSLVNLAVALITLPLGSTLNRVMITELALPATLVAVLLALGNLTSPLRIWFGRISDTRPIGGLHRTWYIAFGIAIMLIGLVIAPSAIFTIPTTVIGGCYSLSFPSSYLDWASIPPHLCTLPLFLTKLMKSSAHAL